MKLKSHPYFLVLALIVSGCTLHHVPGEIPIGAESIPPFKAVGAVKLINTQESLEDITVPVSPYTVTINYRQYTELVMKALRSELDKRAVGVSAPTQKEIRLAIVDLKMFPLVGSFRCIVNTTVETGDGYVRGIEVVGASWNYQVAIDTAVANVAVGVLNDEKVLSYLEK